MSQGLTLTCCVATLLKAFEKSSTAKSTCSLLFIAVAISLTVVIHMNDNL